MPIKLRRALVVALAVLASAVALIGPASAAPADASNGRDTDTNATCPIKVGAYPLNALCGTEVLWVERDANRFYVFAVRDDGRVMTIWQRYAGDSTWSGWASLGGTAIDGVWLYRYGTLPDGPEIRVLGTDWHYYCNERFTTHWTGWHRC